MNPQGGLIPYVMPPVWKCPKPADEGPLPGEDRIRLDQSQPGPNVRCPIQDNEEEPVVEAEMDPFPPNSPQQDFVSLPEHGVLREDTLS